VWCLMLGCVLCTGFIVADGDAGCLVPTALGLFIAVTVAPGTGAKVLVAVARAVGPASVVVACAVTVVVCPGCPGSVTVVPGSVMVGPGTGTLIVWVLPGTVIVTGGSVTVGSAIVLSSTTSPAAVQIISTLAGWVTVVQSTTLAPTAGCGVVTINPMAHTTSTTTATTAAIAIFT